jgi:predicted RNase H-like nuclease (RuvC/YqgF family)
MSRKTNKLKARLRIAEQGKGQDRQWLEQRIKWSHAEAERLRNELAKANQKVQRLEQTSAFNVEVRQLMERGFRGKFYGVNVTFDLDAMRYSMLRTGGDQVYEIGRNISYIARELADKVEREIMEQLRKDGMLCAY